MNWVRQKIKAVISGICVVVADDELRKNMMFRWLNILLAIVAFFMTAVNVITKEYILMLSTFTFGLLCVINVFLTRFRAQEKKAEFLLFAAEAYVLLAFFLISGIPNGFSALWACLIPSFSLLIFGRYAGASYSLLAFLGIVFLFWTPFGRSLLHYHYTKEFMLRFPFFFSACFLLAFFVESIRAETQEQLLASRAKYKYLYQHDALTGLYNRYGFNRKVDEFLASPGKCKSAVLIMDIDNFKMVNDRYGHSGGDEVLKEVADVVRKTVCEDNVYCRWGGEEFTVFFHCSHDYLDVAEQMRRRMEELEVVYKEYCIHITASIGICITDSMETTTIAKLINRADQCLYKAKAEGKNRVEWEKI